MPGLQAAGVANNQVHKTFVLCSIKTALFGTERRVVVTAAAAYITQHTRGQHSFTVAVVQELPPGIAFEALNTNPETKTIIIFTGHQTHNVALDICGPTHPMHCRYMSRRTHTVWHTQETLLHHNLNPVAHAVILQYLK
jgi:hypothetical protein